jgi:hypothetical protein
MAIAVTIVGLIASPPASALTFYPYIPTVASNVVTVATEDVPNGGTLQIRRGTYGNYQYYWARLSSPASKYNSGYDLWLTVGGSGCSDAGHTTKDINRTTYTSAARRNHSCHYYARIIQRSNGQYAAYVTFDPR